MKQFNKGEAVTLEYFNGDKAYTKDMTVIEYNVHGEVICYWRDKSDNWQTATFPEALLSKRKNRMTSNFL